MSSVHESVLLNEILENLSLKNGEVMVDATAGGGGHSFEICKKFPGIRLVAIDQDKVALDRVKEKLAPCEAEKILALGNFRDLSEILQRENINHADAILFDLGLSSDQLEQSGRGFSFQRDEPLLMTMKANPKDSDLTAIDIVNGWEEDSIYQILNGFGEEKFAKRIAHGIALARKEKDIQTTNELVEIIRANVPASYNRGRIHPATKTFQALRIAVNDELGALNTGLSAGFQALNTGGRMFVISFHSLEDRAVKKFFKACEKEKLAKLLNKKPITAGKEEIKKNPRARSAKLRILEKL